MESEIDADFSLIGKELEPEEITATTINFTNSENYSVSSSEVKLVVQVSCL